PAAPATHPLSLHDALPISVTNPLGLGFEQALVGVKTAGAPQPVADEIAGWPEADYVVVSAGQYDLLVELVAVDRHELLDLTNRIDRKSTRLNSSHLVISYA